MRLIAVAQTRQNRHGFLLGGLAHLHRLEAALQRAVLLDVLVVLAQRGRADALNLAARQHGLQDVRRVDRALGRARANDGVQLVDEHDHVAALFDLGHGVLQALLELAAVLRARQHGRQIQRHHALAAQDLRDVLLHDQLGQALHDGGLAHARLADEHRIVLAPAGEDLHDALDLVLPADHRIQLTRTRGGGQIPGELIQNRRLLILAPVLRRAIVRAGQDVQQLLAGLVQIQSHLDQNVGGHALAFAHQRQQQVLHRDVALLQLPRLPHALLDHLLGARRVHHLLALDAVGAAAQDRDDLIARAVQRHAPQHARRSAGIGEHAQQQVLGAHIGPAQLRGLGLRRDQRALSTLRKLCKICH